MLGVAVITISPNDAIFIGCEFPHHDSAKCIPARFAAALAQMHIRQGQIFCQPEQVPSRMYQVNVQGFSSCFGTIVETTSRNENAEMRADIVDLPRELFYLFDTNCFFVVLAIDGDLDCYSRLKAFTEFHFKRAFNVQLKLSHSAAAALDSVVNMISFRVGESDARILEREIGGGYSARYFGELANFHVCAKLLNNGEHSDPFAGMTLPPLFERCGLRDKIVKRSRERFGTPQRVVEEKIERWMQG